MPHPSASGEQDAQLMWALTVIGTVFLLVILPYVSWFTPGSLGRYRTTLHLLLVGAAILLWRTRFWPIAIGGVGLAWLTSAAAHAADQGG
jgi:hypothetical protein